MNDLTELKITDNDFDLFWLLSNPDKIEFLYNALDVGVSDSMAQQLAKSLAENDIEESRNSLPTSEDLAVGPHRISITVLDDIIIFNSDSIRVIRSFVRKFYRDGHILLLDNTFKKDPDFDIYRYFKAYKLLKLGMPISEN